MPVESLDKWVQWFVREGGDKMDEPVHPHVHRESAAARWTKAHLAPLSHIIALSESIGRSERRERLNIPRRMRIQMEKPCRSLVTIQSGNSIDGRSSAAYSQLQVRQTLKRFN